MKKINKTCYEPVRNEEHIKQAIIIINDYSLCPGDISCSGDISCYGCISKLYGRYLGNNNCDLAAREYLKNFGTPEELLQI